MYLGTQRAEALIVETVSLVGPATGLFRQATPCEGQRFLHGTHVAPRRLGRLQPLV